MQQCHLQKCPERFCKVNSYWGPNPDGPVVGDCCYKCRLCPEVPKRCPEGQQLVTGDHGCQVCGVVKAECSGNPDPCSTCYYNDYVADPCGDKCTRIPGCVITRIPQGVARRANVSCANVKCTNPNCPPVQHPVFPSFVTNADNCCNATCVGQDCSLVKCKDSQCYAPNVWVPSTTECCEGKCHKHHCGRCGRCMVETPTGCIAMGVKCILPECVEGYKLVTPPCECCPRCVPAETLVL